MEADGAPRSQVGAILSGKHDKSADAPQDRPELLHTGPIAIRGVGRATRDFFRPDRATKHRLTAEEREAAARAAVEDATETEQLDAEEVAAAAARAGQEPVSASGGVAGEEGDRLPDPRAGDDWSERVPTAQIPLSWMFAHDAAGGLTSDAPAPRRPPAPRITPVLDFPAALDAAALAELRRLVLERAQVAEPEPAGAPSGGRPVGGEHGVGAFGEPTSGLEDAAFADPSSGRGEGSAKPPIPLTGGNPEDVPDSVAVLFPAFAEAEPVGGVAEELDRTHTSDHAGTVDDAAAPEEQGPPEGSPEAPDDELRHHDQTIDPGEGDGEGVKESGEPSSPPERVEVEHGESHDLDAADLPALDVAEPDENGRDGRGPGDERTGAGDEDARTHASGVAEQDASLTGASSPEASAQDRQVELPAPAAAPLAEGSHQLSSGGEQLPPAESAPSDLGRQEVPEQRADAPESAEERPPADADAEPAIAIPGEGERLEGVASPNSEAERAHGPGDEEGASESSEDSDGPSAEERLSEESAGLPGADSEGRPGVELATPDPSSVGPGDLELGHPALAEPPLAEKVEAVPLGESFEGERSGESQGEGGPSEATVDADPEDEHPSNETTTGGAVDADETDAAGEPRSLGGAADATDDQDYLPDDHDEARAAPVRQSQASSRLPQEDRSHEHEEPAQPAVIPIEGSAEDETSPPSPAAEFDESALADLSQSGASEANPTVDGSASEPSIDTSRELTPAVEPVAPGPGLSSRQTAAEVDSGASTSPAPGEPAGPVPHASARRPLRPENSPPEPAVAAALAAGLRPVGEPPERAERPSRGQRSSAPEGPRAPRATRIASGARTPRAPRPPRTPRGGRGAGGGWDGRVWSYIALAVLAAICVALIVAVVVKTRNDAAVAAKEAAAYTAPPLAAPSPSASVASTQPVVSVIGDELTAGSSSDSGTRAEWPALLASALHAHVKTVAAPGAGYVTKGAGGATLVSEAAQADPASSVVVLFGGGNDASSSSLAVATAAIRAIAAAEAAAPSAKIVVVGPTSSVTTPPPAILAIRDSLQGAAKAAKADWQDPISGGWLSSSSALTTSSGVPNDQGEKALESKLEPVLKGLLQP